MVVLGRKGRSGSRGPMRIAFCLDQGLCTEKAHPKYAFFMSYALAEIGNYVTLYVRGNCDNAYEYFAMPPCDRFQIKTLQLSILKTPKLRVPLKWMFRHWAALETLVFKKHDLVILSEIKIAKTFLQLRKISNVPILFDVHDSKAITKGELDNDEAFVFRNVNGLITTTEALREFIVDTYCIPKPTCSLPLGTLPYSFNLKPFNPESISKWNIFYIGSIHPRQGIDLLFDAATMIKMKKFHLHIIGPDYGHLTKVFQLVKKLGLDDSFTYHGYFPPYELHKFIEESDPHIFVVLAHGKDIEIKASMKAIEYLKYGRPIIAVSRKGISEVLKDNYNALLISKPSAHSLATAIKRVMEDTTLAARISRNALATSTQYTYRKRAEDLISFATEFLHIRV